MDRIRIGTRRSPLAMAQSRLTADALRSLHPGVEIELVPINTGGDAAVGPLHEIGGKGLFTAELESALLEGRIDLAVHSAKDMPTPMPAGLAILATPLREDPRDALVSREGWFMDSLPAGAKVGTSSPRRTAQLLATRPDVTIVPIRGNVGTRLGKVLASDGPDRLDAAVLAMAGMIRLGAVGELGAKVRPLEVERFVPAAGQGVLAVQGVAGNRELAAMLAGIDDATTHAALLAERAVVQALGADCHTPLGVHVWQVGSEWRGLAVLADRPGQPIRYANAAGRDVQAVAARLAGTLLGR